MDKITDADSYLNKHSQWQDILSRLRQAIISTGLEETIKWGAPVYTLDGKNVVGLGAFKSYAGLWFFNGALLTDPKKVLVNAQEGKTKALRQWRFNSVDELDEQLVIQYVNEARANQAAGKTIKPEKSAPAAIPEELAAALNADETLKVNFEQLAPYKQKEYIEHIGSAKREATRQSRLEKALPMIRDGKGLHDKYRNC